MLKDIYDFVTYINYLILFTREINILTGGGICRVTVGGFGLSGELAEFSAEGPEEQR